MTPGRGVTEFIANSWPLLLVVVLLWTFAGAFFMLSRPDLQMTDTLISGLVRRMDSIYAVRDTSEAVKRDFLLAHLITERGKDFRSGAYTHLAIAFVVGGLLILGVDTVTRHLTRREFKAYTEEVAGDVWRAIFKRFVPPRLANEIENILKGDVCLIRPHFTIMFPHNPYDGIEDGYVVVRRKLHYRIMNLVSAPVTHPISVTVVGHTPDRHVTDHKGQHVTLPAVRSLSIAGQQTPIEGFPKEVMREVTLPRMSSDDDAIDVVSELEEVLEVNDKTIHTLGTMSSGIEVTVMNEMRHLIEVQWDKIYLTSGLEKLRTTTQEHRFYDGGILPGTALVLSWRSVTGAGRHQANEGGPTG